MSDKHGTRDSGLGTREEPTPALQTLIERVRAAAAARAPLTIRGASTKAFYGNPPEADDIAALDTRGHAGIVACEPTELFVTARCGTPLAELERVLAEAGQMLAFEPPHFGAGATVGGMVAAGLCGPRRVQMGAVRDFVLGVQIVDGKGDLLRFGGTVMKNVAGYDVSRLMAGSLGTLGVIAEVTLKTLPLPAAELTLRFALDQAAALARINEWAGRPLPISASCWHEGALCVRLSGAAAGIAAARAKLGGEPLADVAAREFWQSVKEHTHPFFAARPLWRVALPATAPPLPGAQLIEWHGGLRWVGGESPRNAARAAGGHATLFRGDRRADRSDAFQALPAPLLALHKRVKHAFDPHGIFNRGRLYAGL